MVRWKSNFRVEIIVAEQEGEEDEKLACMVYALAKCDVAATKYGQVEESIAFKHTKQFPRRDAKL